MSNFLKYPKTRRFYQVAQVMQNLGSRQANSPQGALTEFIGTVKLHGTNITIVLLEEGKILFQSRNRIFGEMTDKVIRFVGEDHFDFFELQAFTVGYEVWRELFEYTCQQLTALGQEICYPITLCGEYAGVGIQEETAISQIEPTLFLFGVRVGADFEAGWIHINQFPKLRRPDCYIHNISEYPSCRVEVDFTNPLKAWAQIEDFTNKVIQDCPVAADFCPAFPNGDVQGEGVVWQAVSGPLAGKSAGWFKLTSRQFAKQGGKVSSSGQLFAEKVQTPQNFVSYAVTEKRLKQGLGEVGLAAEKRDCFVQWVLADVLSEEADTLRLNQLSEAQVKGGIICNAYRFYRQQLDAVA